MPALRRPASGAASRRANGSGACWRRATESRPCQEFPGARISSRKSGGATWRRTPARRFSRRSCIATPGSTSTSHIGGPSSCGAGRKPSRVRPGPPHAPRPEHHDRSGTAFRRATPSSRRPGGGSQGLPKVGDGVGYQSDAVEILAQVPTGRSRAGRRDRRGGLGGRPLHRGASLRPAPESQPVPLVHPGPGRSGQISRACRGDHDTVRVGLFGGAWLGVRDDKDLAVTGPRADARGGRDQRPFAGE